MAKLSRNDKQFREFALSGQMGRVLLHVCLPLALFQLMNELFKLLDTMLAAMISSSTVTAVAYLSQISVTISALGGGLAAGSSIKVSEAFGAGDYDLVKERVSTLYAMCALLSGVILAIFVPFAAPLLRLFNTPEAMIAQGTGYFILEIVGMVIGFFNSVYIAIERARGNSRRIFVLNLAMAVTKLMLSAFFVLGWEPLGFGQPTITLLSLATVLAQCVIMGAGLYFMRQKDNLFGFSLGSIHFRKAGPMLRLSFPIIVEKFAFSYGKTVVNSMCVGEGLGYHPDTVGAVSVSNHVAGACLTIQNGIQEGGSAVISQNTGGEKPARALSGFKYMVLIDTVAGAMVTGLILLFLEPICTAYSAGNAEFAAMIAQVYHYEAITVIPLGIVSAIMGLMYGVGKTKLTLVMNFCRVFVFRIPVLYYLQHFTTMGRTDGPNTIGLCLAVSNALYFTLAVVLAAVVVRKICKEHNLNFWTCK